MVITLKLYRNGASLLANVFGVGFIDWLGVVIDSSLSCGFGSTIIRQPLVNRVPVRPTTLGAKKITTRGACGLPTNATRFPDRPLKAARRTTYYPSARLGLDARGQFLREDRHNELL